MSPFDDDPTPDDDAPDPLLGDPVYRGGLVLPTPSVFEADLVDDASIVDEDQLSAPTSPSAQWISSSGNTETPAEIGTEPISASAGHSEPAELDLAVFYNEHRVRLVRGLSGMFRGDIDHAEDVAQEAFETVLRLLPRLSTSVDNPYAYVYRTAVRLAGKWIEKQREDLKRWEKFTRSRQHETAEPNLDTCLVLVRAISRLPEHERDVMALSLMDLPTKEIAEFLGRNHATVRSQRKRALKRLLEDLGEN